MSAVRVGILLVALVILAVTACGQRPLADTDLLAAIEAFESKVDGKTRDEVQRLLRVQAEDFKGRRVSVPSAVVASTYVRENPSHIYFGSNYDDEDHLFLSEIDPPLHEALVGHRHWVSVVKTYGSRQLSYELPVEEDLFNRLEQGAPISFTCTVAALIRGKSVYCAPHGLETDA